MPHPKPTNIARWAETSGEAASGNITEPASGQKDSGWTNGQKPVPGSYFNWWMNTVHQWIKWLVDLQDQAFTWTAAHIFRTTVTAAPLSGNQNGVTASGFGTGIGVSGTGGATSGAGVYGLGLGGNAPGVKGDGQGTGAGLEGLGGGTTGPGAKGTGAANVAGTGGIGVLGQGGFSTTNKTNAPGLKGVASSDAASAITPWIDQWVGVLGRALDIGVMGVGDFIAVLGATAVNGGTGVAGDDRSATGGVALSGYSVHGIGCKLQADGNFAPLRIVPRTAPATPSEGDIYYDSGTHKHYGYNGSAWTAMY